MNYLNKIQNIGFKSHKSVVLCDYDNYVDKIDGVYIADVSAIIRYGIFFTRCFDWLVGSKT